jgi:hypothetical protein
VRSRFDFDGDARLADRLDWFCQNFGTAIDPNTELMRLRAFAQQAGESAINFSHRLNGFAINMQHRPTDADLLAVFRLGLRELDHKRLALQASSLGAAVEAVTRDEQLLAEHKISAPVRSVLATGLSGRNSSPSVQLCGFCGRGVHEEADCTFKAARKCSNCFEVDSGHHFSECPKPARRPPTLASPPPARRGVGDRAQRRGPEHRPDPQRQQRYRSDIICYVCRRAGHVARDCKQASSDKLMPPGTGETTRSPTSPDLASLVGTTPSKSDF